MVFQQFHESQPDKFQAICIGKKAHDNIESFQIGQTNIKCEENVTLLGINIYFMLKFDNHVAEICKKASKQLAVLKRLGSFKPHKCHTAVWPNFFHMNIFFALKGSKLFIIICCHCSWVLCRVAAVKSLPALIYSADYISLLVL